MAVTIRLLGRKNKQGKPRLFKPTLDPQELERLGAALDESSFAADRLAFRMDRVHNLLTDTLLEIRTARQILAESNATAKERASAG